MSGVLYAATLATALGCGLVAGVFFAFSSFVMASLKRLPSAQGIAAMQSINIVAGWALISMGGAPLALVLIGCALYLVGAIGVTIAFNVPLNNRLEKLHSRDAGAAGFWDQYLTRWTAWNHVRTVAALAAAATLTIALHV
jgi:uncharacterized membrane protein